jgi:hypothetical protein
MVDHLSSPGYLTLISNIQNKTPPNWPCNPTTLHSLYRTLSNTVHGKSEGLKIAGGTGPRYLVNLALMATEKAFDTPKLASAISRLSLTDYREFSSADPQIKTYLDSLLVAPTICSGCSAPLTPHAKFCSECGHPVLATSIVSSLLEESVDALSISTRLKTRVKPKFPTVGDVVQSRRRELMQIPYIKDVRSRIIKNAADEFISG